MKGEHFCGLTFKWNYTDGYVDMSMPGYVERALARLQHKPMRIPQYSPHEFTPILRHDQGARQFTKEDTSPFVSKEETKWVQSVVGSFLYYGRAIDSTILPALNEIGTQQAHPTTNTIKKCQRLLDYMYTYKNTSIRYHKSDMLLHVDSDAAYLILPKARSRVTGYFQLTNNIKAPTFFTNGAILIECKALRHVVASSAEAEVGGIFHNAQQTLPIRIALEALDHPQPPTPIKTDNSTAHGFIYKNINMKKSKSWDMRYHWLRDRENQKQFDIYWKPGVQNHADYWTKHHPVLHHRSMRAKYVQDHDIK